MKKLFTLTSWLVIFATLLLTAAGCSDSDPVDEPEAQFVTGVTIPLSMGVTKGEQMTLTGRGFLEGDYISLKEIVRGGEFSATTISVSPKALTFTIPVEVEDATAYKFYLNRAGASQVLGASRLSVEWTVPDKAGMTIKGVVYNGTKGVKDVIVSDGVLFTTTDQDGFYWLASQKKNGNVFIVLPKGYDVATDSALPSFWARCTAPATTVEQHNFALYTSKNTDHTMLVCTDIHLANRNTDVTQFTEGFINEVKLAYNTSASKVYCLNLGDFSWDNYWYSNNFSIQNCQNTIRGLNFQFWSTMGNHDNDPRVAGDFLASAPYRQFVGPTFYSMNIGNIHYIMLDNIEYLNPKANETDRSYSNRIIAEGIDWLKKDLSYVDKATPIIVGMHAPLYYNGFSGGKLTTSVAFKTTADLTNLLNCFKDYNNVQILTGHSHVNRNITITGYATTMMEHNIAAVSGSWWWTKQYANNNICTDGTPGGYKVFAVKGNDVKWQYKAIGIDAERQFTTFDMNKVKEYWATNTTAQAAFAGTVIPNRVNDYADVGSNVVYINVWDFEPDVWSLKVKEGGTELTVTQVWKYDPLHTISYDIPRAAKGSTLSFPSTYPSHMFAVTASSPTSTLDITVTDRFGKTYTEKMSRPKELTQAVK